MQSVWGKSEEEAVRELVGLLGGVCWRWRSKVEPSLQEDFEEEQIVTLLEALRDYRVEKGTFFMWCCRWLKQHYTNFVKGHRWYTKWEPRLVPESMLLVEGEDGESVSPLDQLWTSDDTSFQEFEASFFQQLTSRQCEILKLKSQFDITNVEVAQRLHCSSALIGQELAEVRVKQGDKIWSALFTSVA